MDVPIDWTYNFMFTFPTPIKTVFQTFFDSNTMVISQPYYMPGQLNRSKKGITKYYSPINICEI